MNIHQKILKYKKVSNSELRNFGLVMSGAVLIIFYIFVPFVFHKPIQSWPFALSCYFFFFAFFLQENLRWIYVPWMLIAEVLGYVNSRVILSVFFFAVMTPVGMILRLMGKDVLKRKFEKDLPSYRAKHEDIHTSPYGF